METVDDPDVEEYNEETPNESEEGLAFEPPVDLSFLGDDIIKEKPMP